MKRVDLVASADNRREGGPRPVRRPPTRTHPCDRSRTAAAPRARGRAPVTRGTACGRRHGTATDAPGGGFPARRVEDARCTEGAADPETPTTTTTGVRGADREQRFLDQFFQDVPISIGPDFCAGTFPFRFSFRFLVEKQER